MSIYLDNNASTPIHPSVMLAMAVTPDGNAQSIHRDGREAALAIIQSENTIKDEINGHDGKIFWTANGSHANVLISNSRAAHEGWLTTSKLEHSSILEYTPSSTTLINVDKHGQICMPSSQEWDNDKRRIYSFCMVNNETGVIQNIVPLVPRDNRKFLLHSDAVQALGKIPIDVKWNHIDALTLSAHKIGGPKGIGCLWVSNKWIDRFNITELGTPNTAGIVGFGTAVSLIDIQKSTKHYYLLRSTFTDELFNTHGIKAAIVAHTAHKVLNTISLCFPNLDGDELMMNLDDQGVIVSTGSACNSGAGKVSHVLTAMGLQEEDAKSTIRVSFGMQNTLEEVVRAVGIIASVVNEMRK